MEYKHIVWVKNRDTACIRNGVSDSSMMHRLPAVWDISAWGGLKGLTTAGAIEAGKESTKSKTEEVQH